MSILNDIRDKQADLKKSLAITSAREAALTRPPSRTFQKSRKECLVILDRLERTTGKRSSLNRDRTPTRSEIIAAIGEVETLMKNPIIAAGIPDEEVKRLKGKHQNIAKPITPAKTSLLAPSAKADLSGLSGLDKAIAAQKITLASRPHSVAKPPTAPTKGGSPEPVQLTGISRAIAAHKADIDSKR
ncbi:MAG: hypothetical protein ACSHX9_02155 [Luteolibacter sp.]